MSILCKYGHISLHCYHIFDQHYPNPRLTTTNNPLPPPVSFHNPQGSLVISATLFDPSWYPDSSASNNLTYDPQISWLEQITLAKIWCKLVMGKVWLLQMFHCLTTLYMFLVWLKICKDNEVFFKFHPNVHLVESYVTKEILLQGTIRDGLYAFDTNWITLLTCTFWCCLPIMA